MKKQPLSQTNPLLKDPEERRFWIATTVISSAAIDGVHISKDAVDILRKSRSPSSFDHRKSSGPQK